MDAKVLRAAVSAAIRVTVSTTLVGCGNTVSNDAAPSAASGSTSRSDDVRDAGSGGMPSGAAAMGQAGTMLDMGGTALDMGGTAPSNGGTPSSSTGGKPLSTPEVGGTAHGGASTAGQASGGSEAEAGAPAQACGANVLDCLSVLEMVERGVPLDEVSSACCVSVRGGLVELKQAGAECYLEIAHRFQSAPARQACCKDPSTWQETACAPWGPPVPPELRLDLLPDWAAVA
jgi:hypothetical protein